jgi:flagellar FliJ protein
MSADKLKKLAVFAKMAEQVSAKELSASNKSHQEKLAQLEQLLRFRDEYDATLREKGQGGMSAAQMQDYRMFIGNLNQAIEEQRQQVDNSVADLAGVEANYRSRSQRKQALDHLVDQRRRGELRAREKAEQKESDDRAMANYRNEQRDGAGT